MYHVKIRTTKERRKVRTRGRIAGKSDKLRLSVFRSNKYIYGQIIDDQKGITLVSVDNESKTVHKGKKKVEAAFEMGKVLAKKAKENKIDQVVFDRGSYRYHGRVKAFADGAREGGLKL